VTFTPSSVELFEFKGRSFYVKRDDLTHPLLSGNKYRKLHFLLQTDSSKYTKIISYGGTQSNAMLAIATLAKLKNWDFLYYIKEDASTQVLSTINSNYALALSQGMEVETLDERAYTQLVENGLRAEDKKIFFIPQGGATLQAQEGIAVLADEIKAFQKAHNIQKLRVITPSGTGTTAYFLAKYLPQNSVLTTSGVGSNEYLKEQMSKLGTLPQNLEFLASPKKYHFGKLHKDLLQIYQELEIAGITFDLLYAPKLWISLMASEDASIPSLYVHSGGVSGNKSMLERYLYKGWV